MTFIYSTFPNKKEAKEIASQLVEEKLAGCVNIFPIESVYFWKGSSQEGEEVAVIIKTKKDNFRRIEEFLLNYHSEETPCIVEIPTGKVTRGFFEWIEETLE